MKSGYVDFGCMAMLPSTNKTNANPIYHIALAGADPFSIYVVTLTSDYKIKYALASKDAHFQTITGVFVGPSG